MHKLTSISRTLTALLLVALLSFFSLNSAIAADYDEEKALKEKVEQLDAEIESLTNLLKTLTLQVQRVSDEAIYDLEEFRPRIFSVEKLTKDNTFELKKMSGTVAELSEQVAELSDLPEHVYSLKNKVEDVKSYVYKKAEEIDNRIATNELGINQLQAAVERSIIVTQSFEESLGRVYSRLEGSEGNISMLHAGVSELQSGLEALAIDVDAGYSAISDKFGQIDGQVAQLNEALMQVDHLAGMVSEFQVQMAEVAARQEKTEVRQSQMKETFDRLANVHGQLEQLHAQLLVTSRHVEENSRQLQENTARLGELQSQMGGDGQYGERVAELFAQFENTQRQIAELEASMAGAKEEIKRDVLRSIPRVPSTEEIVLLIEESTAAQVKEAQARADAAQGIAIVALMTGLAAVAVALLLP
jgi:DNA repair ATPase RecN